MCEGLLLGHWWTESYQPKEVVIRKNHIPHFSLPLMLAADTIVKSPRAGLMKRLDPQFEQNDRESG